MVEQVLMQVGPNVEAACYVSPTTLNLCRAALHSCRQDMVAEGQEYIPGFSMKLCFCSTSAIEASNSLLTVFRHVLLFCSTACLSAGAAEIAECDSPSESLHDAYDTPECTQDKMEQTFSDRVHSSLCNY